MPLSAPPPLPCITCHLPRRHENQAGEQHLRARLSVRLNPSGLACGNLWGSSPTQWLSTPAAPWNQKPGRPPTHSIRTCLPRKGQCSSWGPRRALWRAAPPGALAWPGASSQTRGRGGAQAPGHCRYGPGLRPRRTAGAPAAGLASGRLQVTRSSLTSHQRPSKPNPGYLPLRFPSTPAALRVLPLFYVPGIPTLSTCASSRTSLFSQSRK